MSALEHRFRYVQVTGYPGNATTLQRNIMADRFYSALSAGSSFDSSSVILNTIQVRMAGGSECRRRRFLTSHHVAGLVSVCHAG